jgi:Family of unknown function (DUF6167)
MRRLFWLGLGVGLGAFVVYRADKLIRSVGPAGLGDALGARWTGLRELADTVREGMDQREAELRAALALDADHHEP